MRNEYLRVDNGIKKAEGSIKLFSIYFSIFQNECNGFISGNVEDFSEFIESFFLIPNISGGRIYYKGMLIDSKQLSHIYINKFVVIDGNSKIIEGMSLAENVFLMGLNRGLFKNVNEKEMAEKLQALFKLFNIHMDARHSAENISELERYYVELLRAYMDKRECVILDFRKVFVTEEEYKKLFAFIEMLKQRKMTFVFLNYDYKTVCRYSESITIISNGKTLAVLDGKPFNEDVIYKYLKPEKERIYLNGILDEQKYEPVMEFKNLSGRSFDIKEFTMYRGEAYAFIGKSESVLNECSGILQGEVQYYGDMILKKEKYAPGGLEESISKGVCFLGTKENNRLLFEEMSVYDNCCMLKARKVGKLWRNKRYMNNFRLFLEQRMGKGICEKNIRDMGEIEKELLIYYRYFLYNPAVLVWVEPLGSSDINKNKYINSIINEFKGRGTTVLILTRDIYICNKVDVTNSIYI